MFIYQLERHRQFSPATLAVFQELSAGHFQAVTSVVTLMEVVVRPLRLALPDVADDYDALISRMPNLRVVTIDARSARRAAELRATHRLHPADALQIAACIEHGARAFLTNDHDLRRVTEIPILLLSDFLSG